MDSIEYVERKCRIEEPKNTNEEDSQQDTFHDAKNEDESEGM